MPRSPFLQVRYLSGERGGGRRGFLGEFLDSLKQELNKNKEMKESIRKFREEAKKLEESDALKQARRKYVSIQPQTLFLSVLLFSQHRMENLKCIFFFLPLLTLSVSFPENY